MTLPACRGSGNSAKKFRKTRASLSASGPEEGSCNVIATLRHDQSATDRITPNQVAGRLEVRPESPCRAIPGEPDYVLASKSLRRFRISAFCHELLHAITLTRSVRTLDFCFGFHHIAMVGQHCSRPASLRHIAQVLQS